MKVESSKDNTYKLDVGKIQISVVKDPYSERVYNDINEMFCSILLYFIYIFIYDVDYGYGERDVTNAL